MSIRVGVSRVYGVWEDEGRVYLVVGCCIGDYESRVELLHEDGQRFWADYEMVEEVSDEETK